MSTGNTLAPDPNMMGQQPPQGLEAAEVMRLNPEVAEYNNAQDELVARAKVIGNMPGAFEADNTTDDSLSLPHGTALYHTVTKPSQEAGRPPITWRTDVWGEPGKNGSIARLPYDYLGANKDVKWVRVNRADDGSLHGAIVKGNTTERELSEAESLKVAGGLLEQLATRLQPAEQRHKELVLDEHMNQSAAEEAAQAQVADKKAAEEAGVQHAAVDQETQEQAAARQRVAELDSLLDI